MDGIRLCPVCKLAYRPDSRIHKDPEEYCPRCGANLEANSKNWHKELDKLMVK